MRYCSDEIHGQKHVTVTGIPRSNKSKPRMSARTIESQRCIKHTRNTFLMAKNLNVLIISLTIIVSVYRNSESNFAEAAERIYWKRRNRPMSQLRMPKRQPRERADWRPPPPSFSRQHGENHVDQTQLKGGGGNCLTKKA
jgi:hypothetical protein